MNVANYSAAAGKASFLDEHSKTAPEPSMVRAPFHFFRFIPALIIWKRLFVHREYVRYYGNGANRQ